MNRKEHKIKSKQEAEFIKQKAIEITAQTLQDEFEDFFKDNIEAAYEKLQEVTIALGDELATTSFIKDNRFYLYEILMDNTVEEITADIKQIVKTSLPKVKDAESKSKP